jgi:hypothetical protein
MGKNHIQERLILERFGLINKNRFGSIMKIVEYKNYDSVVVKFLENGNLVNTCWDSFCKGSVKNPYDKSIYDVGFLGIGDYKSKIGGGKLTHKYVTWHSMMKRCYKEKQPTYKDCTVAPEWHNFQNFAEWYDEYYYTIEGEKVALDKDILFKGNKIYSPETCIFVPQRINSLFVKANSIRGDLPIGVSFNAQYKKYLAVMSILGRKVTRKFLGNYDTPEEAFLSYKTNKEKFIKQIAEDYKNKIPTKLYSAMMNYIVEITD